MGPRVPRHKWRAVPARALLSKIFWIAMLALAQHAIYGAEHVDPSLVPSIFAPESAPAHAISYLASFVLAITSAIFVVVAGLLVYAVVRFRRRANDDGT